jgi:hypothetical protein
MITAQQARENAEQSAITIVNEVERLGKWIDKVSKEGDRKYRPGQGFCHNEFFKLAGAYEYRTAEMSKPQRLVKAELEKLGFTVRIITEEHDGLGGLGNMETEPKPFKTHQVEISW